jgi:membrane associated rhomboid family serine protease
LVLSLIPISDANPTRSTPYVTIGLIVANVLAFLFLEPSFGNGIDASAYFFENAPLPCQAGEVFNLEGEACPDGVRLTANAAVPIPDRDLGSLLASVVLSTFLHAGFLHIIGNMLFLWVFGNNIEDFLGHTKYLVFYLLAGMAASFAHILTHLNDFIPSVGASGAVAGVMGAYLVLHPRARVNVLVPIFFFITVTQMSAWLVLGIWFLYQFLIGAQEAAEATSVAWMAHVGGFVFGAVAIFLLGGRPQRPRPQFEWTGR